VTDTLERLVDAVMRDEAWSSFWSRDECRALLRAALKELRDPSDAMIAAALVGGWRAMIDAIRDGTA
jgi:hypothetical protein